MTHSEIEARRRLYSEPDPALIAHQRRQLVELGDGLAAQFAELERDFTPERAERLLHNMAGACAHIRRLVAQEAK